MMRKEGLLKYTIFLLVCFFSLIIASNAADDGTVTTNVTLPYGSSYSISKVGYTNFTCDTSNLSALTATSNSTGYSVKLKEVMKDKGTETITCTYDKKTAVNNAGADTNGKKIYKITYTGGTEETFEYYLGFGVEYIDVVNKLGATKITEYSVQTKGSEYISMSQCTKNSANCKVYMSDMVKNLDSDDNYIAIVVFKYKVSGSDATYTANVHFNINAFQGAFIWDNWTDSNPLGYCEYGSDWKQATTDTRSNGQKFYYYKSSSPNATLPNCTPNPSSVVPVKFKGWISGVDGTTSVSFGNGNNSYLYATGKCPTTISSGTKVEANANYAPCYEMDTNYVRLSLSTGKVTASGWTVSTSSNYEYYHTASSAEETIALPDVEYTGFNESKSLQCWKNTTTGECLEAGTLVKTDGTVYQAVTDAVHTEYSYYKSVKVNDAVVFAVEGMKSCSIASGEPTGYISVSDMNGDCIVVGLKETDPLEIEDPAYIKVDIELENGSKKIYKFSVESDVGIGAAGNGQFIVNPNVNSGEENSYTDSSGFKTSSCNTFNIKPGEHRNVDGTSFWSNIYDVTPENCNVKEGQYYAACLDPGREAPENGETYERVSDIKADSQFGKLINYLVANDYVEEFGTFDSYRRVAAHVAIRIVAIQSGMGASSGIAYAHLQAPYQNIVSDIAGKDSMTAAEYAAIVLERMPSITSSIADIVGEILASYDNGNDVDSQGFERTIDSSTTAQNGNGYIITYKGTITAPSNASNVNLVAPDSKNGVSFAVTSWSEGSVDEKGRTTYNYEVQITAADTLAVIPPVSEDDKLLMSFRVEYDGGKTLSNVFLTQPVGTAGALQRMIVFNVNTNGLYIYFNVAPNDCELPGLDYTKCTSADNCPASSFNSALFKASGCCRYVADEVTYSYVVNNVCAAACTTSTMANVCDYSSSDRLAELYEIREGSTYDTAKGYQNAIATCVVNVDQDIRVTDSSVFEKTDDNGNSITIKSYKTNTYCRINCKEDWQISMDGFGNYVGEKAIAAGSYFQIENDIFIGGKRTCYTNYIDYNAYMNDLVNISVSIISSYNSYSNLSHSYSDILKQQDGARANAGGLYVANHYTTLEADYYEVADACEDNPKTPEDESKEICGTHIVKTNVNVMEDYYAYNLKVNNQFQGADDVGEGTYQAFNTTPFDSQGTVSEGSVETQTKLDSTEGVPTQYDGGTEQIIVEIERHTEPGTGSCTPSLDEPCYIGHREDKYISTKTSQGTSLEPFTDDSAADRERAFKNLSDEMLKRLKAEMAGPRGAVSGGAAKIRTLIDEMYECQHFQLVNTTDDNNSDYEATIRLVGQYYPDGQRPYTEITTAYEPDVSYEYAEDAFMSILLNNKENYLVKYDKKNDAYYGGTEGAYKNATNRTESADIKLSSTQTEKVNLSRNYLQFTYYKSGSLWDAKSEIGKNYDNGNGSNLDGKDMNGSNQGVFAGTFSAGVAGYYKTKTISLCGISGGGSGIGEIKTTTNSKGISSSVLVGSATPEWEGGGCFDADAIYLEANYIKASIDNSSFYRNQGSWYSNIQDVKAHGDGLEAALNNENTNNKSGYKISSELSSGRWTPIGIINVFPISLTTPRNLYTYTYTFKDIGSLYGGDLGRIMGNENAIIANNNRTCFYEVFEELCLCCGDKINTYVYNDPDENDLIKQVMSASGYGESNTDKIENNQGGTLAFATTSVNLSDIDVDENSRPVASNWSNSSPFIYGGEYNLTTSKGEQLKNAIESQGETIYSSSSGAGGAEYAYYLTPTTLTKIREYNDEHGYELNYNNLKVYGRYSIALLNSSCSTLTDDKCWQTDETKMNDEVINFQHYGSVFLENLAKDSNIAKSSTLAKEGNDKVCVVVDGQFDANTINTLVKSGCRWIDYVENLSDNSGKGETSYVYPYTESTNSKQTVTYFRLAFK